MPLSCGLRAFKFAAKKTPEICSAGLQKLSTTNYQLFWMFELQKKHPCSGWIRQTHRRVKKDLTLRGNNQVLVTV